jgi:hypothetical protein
MGSHQVEEVDVLLVGAGFASFTLLNRLVAAAIFDYELQTNYRHAGYGS